MPFGTNVDIGFDGAAARGLSMIMSARVSNELAAEIDRVADAQGQSRAAWMANVIARAVLRPENDDLPSPAPRDGRCPDE